MAVPASLQTRCLSHSVAVVAREGADTCRSNSRSLRDNLTGLPGPVSCGCGTGRTGGASQVWGPQMNWRHLPEGFVSVF